ncbi:hypothetical protein QTH34_01875 [Clostridium perfringens]|uniref:Uncharacterized protein n=2 Tax=Clostridium perfringens TaxID=1502 RepID=A0AAP7BVE0_CLOPF|nr:hypothetical protein [Clostridium perfringens]EDT22690.1 hypothetical protein AC1_1146 [Clostridium perfringens B str. ATCC 3626]AOY53389.1 hypothetical protein FORC25_0972 [Clostridium perfringens]EDS79099.1 hypothetical protein CPC_0992 [Clostridium perfringens C str. JGS1495]EHK2278017.1 hypothetical protein [Clostridium perfringens]EHK2401003.1 hypothetical protein [Clostridium perfringens]
MVKKQANPSIIKKFESIKLGGNSLKEVFVIKQQNNKNKRDPIKDKM